MDHQQYEALPQPQREALESLAERYKVPVPPPSDLTIDPFDQPPGFICGWVGPIYVGISPEGQVHS